MMVRFSVLAALLFLLPAGYAASWAPGLVFASPPGGDLKLDIYYPTTPPPPGGYPVILSFHGGGWIIGGRHRDLFLRGLVREGFALVSPQYRLSNRAKFPAQIEDARAAAHWLVKNAKALRLDPDRVVATGASAGGQLALLLAFSAEKTLVSGGTPPLPPHFIKAVCVLYPVTDLYGIVRPESRDSPQNLVAFLLGGSVREKEELARLGSPISHVTADSPPVWFFHGDKDPLVPLEQSRTLQRKLAAAGVKTRLVIREGRSHAFGLSPAEVREVGAFFRRAIGD
jgi:acetyl esterase/lipase